MLDSWQRSATRLTEDLAAEADLIHVGYRDRLVVELAANAADAAAVAGVAGELRFWTTELDDRSLLHVANSGEPLTASGVRALAALRASSKIASHDGIDRVGRFGVGFTAVATVADRVEIRSTSGSIVFDAARSADAAGAPAPMLRLPWPSATPPESGYATEVVLALVADRADASTVLQSAADQAVELLLCLPALRQITVGDLVVERVDHPDGDRTKICVGNDTWWQYDTGVARWLIRVDDDIPRPAGPEVLFSPTRTDIALSLPFRVVAQLSLTPDRRGLDPDTDPAMLARGYGDVARALPPAQQLLAIPAPGFPLGPEDGTIRQALIDELSTQAWLLPAHGDVPLVPQRAELLVGLTADLAAALGPLAAGFVHPDHSSAADRTRLQSVGVREIGIAEVIDRLAGTRQSPQWWRRLYDALAALAHDPAVAADLGALPVPRAAAPGMAVGPRSVVLLTPARDVPWLPVVHPDAMHPLLERLGAQRLSAAQALADPALRAMVDDPDADGSEGLALAVLTLAAASDTVVPSWLGGLLLRTVDGDYRPADELLLPGSPLAGVLVDDHPFGVVADDLVETFGRQALSRIGVGWTFTTVLDELPTAPDHDLPDEAHWWDSRHGDPDRLLAIRDLDLVHPDRWPEALAMLTADFPDHFAERAGYTAWWLRNFAELNGRALGEYRAPDDSGVVGLFDELPLTVAGLDAACGSSDIDDDADLDRLLTALADPARTVGPAVIARVHSAAAAAYASGRVGAPSELPSGVRTLSGAVADPEHAMVLDASWMLAVCDPDRVVVAADVRDALALAQLLDVPLTSEVISARPISVGRTTDADSEPELVRHALTAGLPLPRGPITLHDELIIEATRHGRTTRHRVEYWVHDGQLHRAAPRDR